MAEIPQLHSTDKITVKILGLSQAEGSRHIRVANWEGKSPSWGGSSFPRGHATPTTSSARVPHATTKKQFSQPIVPLFDPGVRLLHWNDDVSVDSACFFSHHRTPDCRNMTIRVSRLAGGHASRLNFPLGCGTPYLPTRGNTTPNHDALRSSVVSRSSAKWPRSHNYTQLSKFPPLTARLLSQLSECNIARHYATFTNEQAPFKVLGVTAKQLGGRLHRRGRRFD